MYKNECRNFNGEFIVVWNDEKTITMGPEQMYGSLFCPINFYFADSLEELQNFINNNQLLLPNNNLDGSSLNEENN